MRRLESHRRTGFTLIEVMVALVFLSVVAVSLGAVTEQAIRTLRRSRLELDAARFTEVQAEQLRLVAYDALQSGSATSGRGVARWTVEDSTSFRRILLETRYGSPATGLVVDSVTLFRGHP